MNARELESLIRRLAREEAQKVLAQAVVRARIRKAEAEAREAETHDAAMEAAHGHHGQG